jgi:hypothetical protein
LVKTQARSRKFVAVLSTMLGLLMLLPATAADGPWIDIVSPEDGGWVTDPLLAVSGNTTPPIIMGMMGPDFLANGTGFGMQVEGLNLTMRPRELFSDHFNGNELDTNKWTVLRSGGQLSVAGGTLNMGNTQRQFPLIQSTGDLFDEDIDWTARIQMMMTGIGYSGSGGGISAQGTDREESHIAAYNLWSGWQQPSFNVYSNGLSVFSAANDYNDNLYTLSYDSTSGSYRVDMNSNQLDTFYENNPPDHFWFGSSMLGTWAWYSNLAIDYVDVWAFNGVRTFRTLAFPHVTAIDRLDLNWTTSNKAAARVVLEARMSNDNQTWSMWVPMLDGIAPEPLEGLYLQLRLKASMGGYRTAGAWIRIHDIEMQRHHPIVSVEVRNLDTDGEWSDATGLTKWNATLPLQEDMNTIEVRATDTSGAVNLTSFEQLLDTTPPAGTMQILKDRVYTNDLNVTLYVNATDRYGVGYVQVSNAADFRSAVTYPYSSTIDWTMGGIDGHVACFVRFIDAHGLLSDTVTDTIIYDSIAPTGSLAIDGGREYTPTLTVDLEVSHSDTRGVELVELSNHANFSDVRTMPVNKTFFTNWTLTDGDDGPRQVFMRLTDLAGNSRQVNDTIGYYVPKALGGLTIEGGANLTSKIAVDIVIDVPRELRPPLMQLSNDAAFIGATWEVTDDEIKWILSPDDGPKVVYLRFTDFRDIVSLPVSASIILDTTPPVVDVLLDNGAMYTIDENVSVEIVYDDASPIVSMWVSRIDRYNDVDEEAFDPTFTWTVPPREADHNIYIKVKDQAGNEATAHSSIHFASLLPKVNLSLPDGEISPSVDYVLVGVETEDAYGGIEYQASMDQDPEDGDPWFPDEESVPVTIPKGTEDGIHQIRVRAKNAAGLTSAVYTIDVTLDRTAPDITVVLPVDGSVVPQPGLDIQLQLEAFDPSGISQVRYRLDGGDWTIVPKANLTAVVTLGDFGEHTIEAEVSDGVGNAGQVSTTFSVDDSEAQVSTGSSWIGLLVLLAILVAIGVLYQYRRHHGDGKFLGLGGQHGKERSGPTPGDVDGAGTPTVATSPHEEVPPSQIGSTGDAADTESGTVHTDDEGTEWEMV